MNKTELKNNSYIPYSGTGAVAVVADRNANLYPGVRIENISFPLTISAVQNALFHCLSEGGKPEKLYIDFDRDPHRTYWEKEYGIKTDEISKLGGESFAPVLRSVDEVASALQKLLKKAVVDQSDFPVSALLETKKGFISGVNIETADWSRGLCAERVALAKAVTYGYTDFKALHIFTRDGEYNSPCGACRQVIIEHLSHHPVYLYHADGTVAEHFSSDLMPYHFQSSKLKKVPPKA